MVKISRSWLLQNFCTAKITEMLNNRTICTFERGLGQKKKEERERQGENRAKRQNTKDRDEIEGRREMDETYRQFRGNMKKEWQKRHRVG